MKSLKLMIYLHISDILDVKVNFILFLAMDFKNYLLVLFLKLGMSPPHNHQYQFSLTLLLAFCLAHYFHFPLQGTALFFSVLFVFHSSLQL